MSQSALTVTPENPTPPTNLSCVGTTPPTDPAQAYFDDGYPPGSSPLVFAAKTAGAGTAGYTSVDAEGKGTETSVVIAPPAGAYDQPIDTVMVGTTAPYTTAPNASHASSLSPLTNPTLTSLSATSTASGTGTVAQTCTGTNFTRQSVIYVNGVAQTTNFTSATSITAPAVTKKATAGTWPVTVRTGGVVETASQNWTFT